MAMSLTGAGRGSGKNLVCGVCREVYRSPRLLPCFHTFCLYCLDSLAKTNGRPFPCPSCRKPTAVPRAGALGFQMNFYITEEELERERKAQTIAMCPTHEMEPLVFFCAQCDLAICIRCRLTKHSEHPGTIDLSEAAKRSAVYLEKSKERLDGTISFLSKKSMLAQGHRTAAKRKGDAQKQQVQAQHDALVQRIGACLATVLGKMEASNSAVEERLTLDTQSVQKELDCLVQLRQSVHHALADEASDADKVCMEKKMRDGEGSESHLRSIRKSIPATTLRSGLHFASDFVSDDDIRRVLGEPVELCMPFQVPGEVIIPVFQCKKTRGTENITEVCQTDSDKVKVSMWDSSSDTLIVIEIDENGRICDKQKYTGLRSGKRYDTNKRFRSTFEITSKLGKKVFRLNSKGFRTQHFQVHHILEEGTTVFRVEVTSENPFELKKYYVLDTNPTMPAAFDATDTGDVIALVEIPTREQSARVSDNERQVCLYRKDQGGPFATYTPKVTNFHPSDVCFMQEDNQDKLLVADTQNDCVHVVSIQEDGVSFERYLAAGDSNLVRPTALSVDDQGRVWIGCDNGSVVRCEKQQGAGSQVAADESDEDDGSDEDDESVASSVAAESVGESHASSLLMVENSSRSTSTRSQLSDVEQPEDA